MMKRENRNGRMDIAHEKLLCLCLAASLLSALFSCSGGKHAGDADEDAQEEQDGDAPADPDIQTEDTVGDDAGEDCEGVVCQDPCVYYVDLNVTTPGDGMTPEDAFSDVQSGIDAAAGVAGACCTCDVWVAEGVYFVHAGSPEDTVLLREGVRVYGGYPTGFSGDRDPGAHVTVLDGRAGDTAGSPRVFHVVTGSDRALLDGFTVTLGRAMDDDDMLNPNNYGGGMYNYVASPDVVGCSFEENEAVFGGGMYKFQSQGTIISSTFTGNRAEESGGGLDMRQSSPPITNCSFSDNEARLGGGLYVRAASAPIIALDSSLPGDCAISGNRAESGGGMHVSFSSPLIRECRFETNDASGQGGAVAAQDSDITIVGSTFSQNSGDAGGAVHLHDTAAAVAGCLFDQNDGEQAGALHAGEGEAGFPLLVVNSIFSGNTSSSLAAVNIEGSDATIANCTFFRNMAEEEGASALRASPDEENPTVVVNSIFWENYGGSQCRPVSDNAAMTYCTVDCWPTDVENHISRSYPLFADSAEGDFRLWPISHAVDSGDRKAIPLDSPDLDGDGERDEPIPYDFAGHDRVQGATVDRGALEMPPNDHDNWPRIYVDAQAGGANNGTTWEDAYTDLNEALTFANTAMPIQLWVAAGTYKPPVAGPDGTEGTFSPVLYTGLFGGFDPAGGADTFAERDWTANETILSGDLDGNDGPSFANYEDNVLHVVTIDAEGAIIDGFTITGGNANIPYPDVGDLEDSIGGGILARSSIDCRIQNCRITANRAHWSGGGIHMIGIPTWVTNCIIDGNRTSLTGGGIGSVALYSFAYITNCTIVNNSSDMLAGVALRYSPVTNSIIWGNINDDPANEYQVSAYLSHCDVQQSEIRTGYDEGGNILLDPLFETGSLRLSAASPCIDAGDNDAVFSMTDYGLDPRIVDGDGRGSDEAHCRCAAGQFMCADGTCIEGALICDGGDDCGDGSDEAGCECGAGQFSCRGGGCIDSDLICDGNEDCRDPSAEVDMGAFEYQP